MTIIINPVPLPPFGGQTYNQITPFTYRDGLTYVEVLEDLRQYIFKLVAELNVDFEEIEKYIDNAVSVSNEWTTEAINTLIEYVNTTVEDIVNNSIELQDPVISTIFDNPGSVTRAKTDTLYAGKSVQTTVENGRLSEPTLTDTITESIADDIENPETRINGSVLNVVNSVLGGDTEGIVKVVRAIGAPNTPRPVWGGVVMWLVGVGELEPNNFAAGDIVSQVSEIGWTPEWGVNDLAGWFDAYNLPLGALASVSNKVAGADFISVNPPTVVADVINGHKAIVSDGVDDYMEMILGEPYTGPVTVFAVAGTDIVDNPAGSKFLWNAVSQSGTDQRASIARTATEQFAANRNVGGSPLTSAEGAWTTGAMVIEAKYDLANSHIRKNDAFVATGSLGASHPEIVKWGLFARNSGAQFSEFYLGEILIIHGLVDSATRSRITSYLTNRWL